jgi:hypothetical protein
MVQLNIETKHEASPAPSLYFLFCYSYSFGILTLQSVLNLLEDIFEEMRETLSQRIMIIDGAMGINFFL